MLKTDLSFIWILFEYRVLHSKINFPININYVFIF